MKRSRFYYASEKKKKKKAFFGLYLFAVKYSLGKPVHQSIENFIRVLLVYGLWTEYFTTGFYL